jgi:hypothetical protein
MIEIRKTEAYARWLDGLRDIRARARVLARVERLDAGNPGDVIPILNQSAIFVGVVVGFLNVCIIRLVASISSLI